MMNHERARALKGIVEEEGAQEQQPVEGITLSFLQVLPEPEVQRFIRCFDQHAGY